VNGIPEVMTLIPQDGPKTFKIIGVKETTKVETKVSLTYRTRNSISNSDNRELHAKSKL